MNNENDGWNNDGELGAYVQAYVEEERSNVEAAAAYERFVEAQIGPPLRLDAGTRRRRAVAFAVAGTMLAAGLAGLWIAKARSFQLETGGDAATLTQDEADTSSEIRAVTPVDPRPPRAGRVMAPEQTPPVSPEPELPASMAGQAVKASPASPGRRRRRRPETRIDTDVPPSSEPSDLARELAMLSALRKSARAREYVKALKLVRAHRVQFPEPTLAAERDLIELEALCGLGQVSNASRAKEAFAKAHPTHHLRAKAKRVCEEKSDGAQNSDGFRHQRG